MLRQPFDEAAEAAARFAKLAKNVKGKDRAKGIERIIRGLTDKAREGGMYGNDPIVDESIRQMMFQRSKLDANWVQDVLKDSASIAAKVGDAGFDDAAGMSVYKLAKHLKLNPATVAANIGGNVKDKIKPQIAADLIKGIEKFKAPESVQGLIGLMDNFHAIFKGAVTSPHLAFHVRNRVGSAIAAFLDKTFDPKSQRAMRGMLDNTPDPYWRTHPLIRQELKRRGVRDVSQVSDGELLQVAQELFARHNVSPHAAGEHMARVGMADQATVGRQFKGIMGQQPGRVSKMSYKDVLDPLKGRGDVTYNPFTAKYRGAGGAEQSTHALFAAGDRAGAIIETMNRGPSFWSLTAKGMSPEQAVRAVNLTQVSYAGADYSPFVRDVILRGVPFGKFQIGMGKKLAHELTTKPGGRHAAAIRFADRLQSHSAGDEPIPDWVAQQMAVKVGESADGDPRYLSGFGLMHEPAVSFLQPSAKRLGMHLLSQLAPTVKLPLEMATGQTFFQSGPLGGRALEDLDPTVGRIGRMVQQRIQSDSPLTRRAFGQIPTDWAPAMEMRGTRTLEHIAANSPISRFLTTARTAIDPRRGILERAMNIGSGFRTTIVSDAARDAQIRDTLAAEFRRHPAGRLFISPYVSAEAKERMSPEELAEVERLEALRNVLMRRSKDRKAARTR